MAVLLSRRKNIFHSVPKAALGLNNTISQNRDEILDFFSSMDLAYCTLCVSFSVFSFLILWQ